MNRDRIILIAAWVAATVIYIVSAIELRNQRDTALAAEEVYTAPPEAEIDEWPLFIEALIFVESSGITDAIGDGGKAVGVLQLHPCVVEDVRIAGYDYDLGDRYDKQKSIEIWNIWQKIYNPEKNIHWAMKLTNPRAPVEYHRRVLRRMNELRILNDEKNN